MSPSPLNLRAKDEGSAAQLGSIEGSAPSVAHPGELASPRLFLDQAHLRGLRSFWLVAKGSGEAACNNLLFSDGELRAELSRNRHALLAVTLIHLVDGSWVSISAKRVMAWTPQQGEVSVVAETHDGQLSLSPPLGKSGRYDVLWSQPVVDNDCATASLSKLRDHHPYMFAQEDMGQLDIYRGWYPRFAALCDEINQLLGADKRGFRWVVAREKFGGARYLYMLDGCVVRIADTHRHHENFTEDLGPQDEVAVAILQKVIEEQRTTEWTCMVCGAPATLSGLKGWVLCLCEAHLDDDIVVNVWENTLVPLEAEIS